VILLVLVIWFAHLARRRAALLAQTQDLLHHVTDRVPGMVFQFRINADGTACFPYASDAIRQIFRVEAAEVVTDAAKIYASTHPEDIPAVQASIQKSAKKLTPWIHEYRVKFADGTVRWLLGSAQPVPAANDAMVWHGFITDITERKAADASHALFERKLRRRRSSKVSACSRAESPTILTTSSRLSSVTRVSPRSYCRPVHRCRLIWSRSTWVRCVRRTFASRCSPIPAKAGLWCKKYR
jgi:PAS domain S-box-containing protein